jgi:Undecaprenyl-phosphate galactose phosphotransferase WbaP
MGIPVFPENQEILDTIKKLKFKVAIMCHYKGNRKIVFTSYRYTITTSKNQDAFTSTMNIRDIGGIIGFSATHNLTRKGYLFFKRLLDLLIILIFLPILLPVMLILAILVKLTSRGPIFYGHKRVGKNGKIIKCWKFRSMVTNSQEMLEHILATDPVRAAEWEKDRKFVDDPRVTKFGKFLRKTSLDELPQLFNIIAGQMSFVGPRPVTESELEKYGDSADYVLSVTPGLSGMWQISGRSDTGYEERIMFDTYYIQNWSIWLDIWILIKTVWVVVKGKGAY